LPMLLWSGTWAEQVRTLVSWDTGHVTTTQTVEAAARGRALEGDTLLGCHEESLRELRCLAECDVDVDVVGEELLRARSLWGAGPAVSVGGRRQRLPEAGGRYRPAPAAGPP